MHVTLRNPWLLLGLLAVVACQDEERTVPVAPQMDRKATADARGPSHFTQGGPAIGLETVATGLTHPVALVEPPDGSGRLFVVDQVGVVRIVDPDGTLLPEPFLDVRDRIVDLMPFYDERGLLGLAFSPDYASDGRFFIYYSAPPAGDFDNRSTVSEFRVSGSDPDRADPGSEQILLQVDQPQFNHEAGTLAFGPDGHLYISIGDGGGANDIGTSSAEDWLEGDLSGHVPDWYDELPSNAGGNGQDVAHNLLGNILRIDVSTPGAYTIPPDNPFVGEPGMDEIYAYGFRNPYRFSFDRRTGDLYVGDAGQDLWEEVDLVQKGGNYGWNVKEGTHCFDAADATHVQETCPGVDDETGDPLIDPVIELANYGNPYVGEDEGITVVVGGYVYRGGTVPRLRGRYVFGAFTTEELDEGPEGAILVARPRSRGLWDVARLQIQGNPGHRLGHFVLGFGEDSRGEVYVLTTDEAGPVGSTGEVFRLVRPGEHR